MDRVRAGERVAHPPQPVPAPTGRPPDGHLRASPEPVVGPGPARVRRRRSFWGELWRWVVTAVVFVTAAAIAAGVGLVGAVYWQARTDQTRPVEAIVVLGTAQFNGRPGRVLQARLDHALGLYEVGYAPLIVVTGGRAPGDVFTEAEAARDYLLVRGVPPEAILLENEGRDSWESMRGVAALLAEADLSRVLLVSDGFHLLRVKLMARDLGLTAFASPATASPIRPGGPGERSYVLREAAGIVVHLWQTRRADGAQRRIARGAPG